MLQNLIAEQETKQARLKQQRTPKIIHGDASIQCARTEAATPHLRQTSDVAVQTNFMDVMADLKEQVKNLMQIVAELTALKSHKHQEPRTIDRPLLAELLSDNTMSDIAEFCPDSSENCGAESPLPGLQHHSVIERPSPQTQFVLNIMEKKIPKQIIPVNNAECFFIMKQRPVRRQIKHRVHRSPKHNN